MVAVTLVSSGRALQHVKESKNPLSWTSTLGFTSPSLLRHSAWFLFLPEYLRGCCRSPEDLWVLEVAWTPTLVITESQRVAAGRCASKPDALQIS